LELDGLKPVYQFHGYEIFKLKVDGQPTNVNNGEIAFLAQSGINLEKCIIYCELNSEVEIKEVKYWRSLTMDNEICMYLVRNFIRNYLSKKFDVP
jgi:hypothetical protein